MKRISYLIITILTLLGVGSCEKGEDRQIDPNFHPRIIDNSGVFTSPSRIINQGDTVVYNNLTFSPKPIEKTKIEWKIDGEVVSDDTSFSFSPTSGGEYEIKLEATYNGQTSTRISKVLVSPDTYAQKTYSHVALAYLSENGKAADVDWAKVTHVAFNGARVVSAESVDFSKGNLNQNIDEIVARGHINGVSVLLAVTGRLSGLDGWALYNSSDFGSVISDPVKRASLVQIIANYVVDRRLDGVDVMMTDLSNDVYAISAANAQAVGLFIEELKAALPDGAIVTATVTVNYMHWEYGNLQAADWINVHAFENGANVGPGAPVGQQSPFSYMVDGANIWKDTKGYPADKLVLGMPAFGLRYDALDENGNNLSWGSYGYMPFKEIVAIDESAAQDEFTDKIGKGVYYNGVPLVTQKAQYIKENNFKGAYLWAVDQDATGANSLMNAINEILN